MSTPKTMAPEQEVFSRRPDLPYVVTSSGQLIVNVGKMFQSEDVKDQLQQVATMFPLGSSVK